MHFNNIICFIFFFIFHSVCLYHCSCRLTLRAYSCWWWIWRKFCSTRELRSRTIHIGRPCEEKYPPNSIRNQVSVPHKSIPHYYHFSLFFSHRARPSLLIVISISICNINWENQFKCHQLIFWEIHIVLWMYVSVQTKTVGVFLVRDIKRPQSQIL